jgi:hypothetical protein
MAGATYAAFYILSQIVVGMIWVIRYGEPSHGDVSKGILVRSLSMNGMILGLVQNLYHVTIHRMMFMKGAVNPVEIVSPTFWILLLVALGWIAAGWAAARMKVRAVEVIRG